MKVNPETQFTEASGKLTQDGFNALQEIADASSGGDPVTPGSGMIDGWDGNIRRVEAGTKTLVQKVSFSGTVTETTTQSGTGTATFTFGVNGVAFSGTANDVSTVEQSQTHSTAFVAGDTIAVTITSVSLCENAAFSIWYTRS